MVYSKCNGKIPDKGNLVSVDQLLLNNAYSLYENSLEFMTNYQIQAYLNSVFDVISETNKYFSDEKPWELEKENPERMQTILWVTCEVLRIVSILLQPVITESSNKLLDFLNVDLDERFFKYLNSDFSLKSGIEIHEPNVIFPKIDL